MGVLCDFLTHLWLTICNLKIIDLEGKKSLGSAVQLCHTSPGNQNQVILPLGFSVFPLTRSRV